MKMFTTVAALTIAALLSAGCSQSGNDRAEERIVQPDAIDAALQRLVDHDEVAGASALIYEQGEEAYFGAFGFADRETGRPMARDTIAQIFSMTKPITGVALMQLYEQGAFQLDDPISKYLPEFADVKVYAGEDENGAPVLVEPKRAPTIRDFTRHTAGLAARGEPGPVAELYRQADPMNLDNTFSEMAERLASVPLLYHPGERWRYGDAVDVQAVLVERLSGKPYADYVRDNILLPLGMNETAYFVPEDKRGRLAATYTVDSEGGPLVRAPNDLALVTREWTLTPGGWGLASTLDDYMRFARMLLGEGELDGVRILKPETVRLMATNQLSADVTDRSWLPSKGQVGFGIDVAVRIAPPASPEENAGAVGEYFWDGAASTLFWVDPENRIASVFFIQRMPFYAAAHTKFRDAVYRASTEQPGE